MIAETVIKPQAAESKSAPKAKAKSARMTLTMTMGAKERLESIRERTDAINYGQVIGQALKLYEEVLKAADDGKYICIKNPADDVEVPLGVDKVA